MRGESGITKEVGGAKGRGGRGKTDKYLWHRGPMGMNDKES